jgi:hypothetical protein
MKLFDRIFGIGFRFAQALVALCLVLLLICSQQVAGAQPLGALNSTATRLDQQTADHVALTGGTIDGVTLGATTPVNLGALCTATGASPQTCNGQTGNVTSGTLTTAALTAATYVINDSAVTANSLIQCSLQAYSGTYVTNGLPEVMDCAPGAGTITVHFVNTHSANALNGTLKFGFAVLH